MSTISCGEQQCIYQKDGICNLDSIKSQKISPDFSKCVYFISKKDVNPNNEQQNL